MATEETKNTTTHKRGSKAAKRTESAAKATKSDKAVKSEKTATKKAKSSTRGRGGSSRNGGSRGSRGNGSNPSPVTFRSAIHRAPAGRGADSPRRSTRKGSMRIVPLGGLGEIGRNMNVVEYNGHTLLIDCGVLSRKRNSRAWTHPA